MQEEINIMYDRKVPPPKNKVVIGNRWVYNTKKDDKGKIIRFKSRLVAQGFKQIKEEFYDETFSP